MTLTLPKTCALGGSKTGLVGTVGVELLNPDGTTHTARATAGIYEIGGGCYGKQIVFPDDWTGSIKWDTGGGSPVYAAEEYAYYENNPKVDAILTDTNELQINQGNWLTATGFSIPNEYDTVIATLPTRTEATADKDEILADHTVMKQTTTGTYDRDTDSLEAIRNNQASTSSIADAVWDEDLGTHTTPGTAGKILSIVRKAIDAIMGIIN